MKDIFHFLVPDYHDIWFIIDLLKCAGLDYCVIEHPGIMHENHCMIIYKKDISRLKYEKYIEEEIKPYICYPD